MVSNHTKIIDRELSRKALMSTFRKFKMAKPMTVLESLIDSLSPLHHGQGGSLVVEDISTTLKSVTFNDKFIDKDATK